MHTRTAILGAVLAASSAMAQVQVSVQLPVPTVTFSAPPPLVVVQPGVQVVEDYDDEVYFTDGFYWVRREGRWFRTRDYRGGWSVVEPRGVPVTIVNVPPGKYRKWKGKHRDGVVVHPGKHKGHKKGKRDD